MTCIISSVNMYGILAKYNIKIPLKNGLLELCNLAWWSVDHLFWCFFIVIDRTAFWNQYMQLQHWSVCNNVVSIIFYYMFSGYNCLYINDLICERRKRIELNLDNSMTLSIDVWCNFLVEEDYLGYLLFSLFNFNWVHSNNF